MTGSKFNARPSPPVGEGPGVRGDKKVATAIPVEALPLHTPSPQGREALKRRVRANSQKDFPAANARAKRLRQEPTHAEKLMWKMLHQLPDAHFRRQVPIGAFVFDFASHRCKLVIEVDGGIHRLASVQIRDQQKQVFVEAQGYRVIRFTNEDVIGGPDSVFSKVEEAVTRPHP